MASIVMAYIVMAIYSYGPYCYGLNSYGLNSYSLFSSGLNSYCLFSYCLHVCGLHSYGLYSYGLPSYGLYSYGPESFETSTIFQAPFDTNGVLHHIGTAGGTKAYQNPHTVGTVVASMSSVQSGDPSHFVQHTHAVGLHGPLAYNLTSDAANSWMAVDLKTSRLVPDHYALRHGYGTSGSNVLRNWELQASNDNQTWTTLRRHTDDTSLAEQSMSVAAWPLDAGPVGGRSFRHFRILQTGKNSNGGDHLMCAGIELYGLLQDA